MKMHLLSGGRLRMRRRVYYPDALLDEPLDLPVSCALIRHGQGNVLFDTGCHPDTGARWGDSIIKHTAPIFRREDTVIPQLSALGLAADDVDIVVCSHLHYDHCGCNAFFTRATIVCHARELEVAQGPDPEAKGYLRGEWDFGQAIDVIKGERDLFGDGRFVLLPAPGHTPGMLMAHVVLDRSGTFVLTSDAAPVAACFEQRYAPRNTADVEACLNSFDEIARLQQAGATVLFGHDLAQWRGVRKGADAYD